MIKTEQTVIQSIAQELVEKINKEVHTHKENALKAEGAVLGIQLLYQEIMNNEKEAEKNESETSES